MSDWTRFDWIDEATDAATIALVAADGHTPEAVLGRLGPIRPLGDLDFGAAAEAGMDLYERDVYDQQGVVQASVLEGAGRAWVVTLEENGYRADLQLDRLAGVHSAVSFFWNVNAVMRVQRREHGVEVESFDPLLDRPDEEHPHAASLALIEDWTGVTLTEDWFAGPKPTYLVESQV
ncbi:DUF6461 domain-containing protein [Solirubrobacter phytolaccae]|uniref:DUF6461 domain-containing protein n=1 Tax=Solirubrobacter phytolaccae TaxID=1404360 RepID=A0A9X3NHV4_9ACTN|nr:DUF6461 domain-containing protein [Solirubrobacter phytolaccae]MDA0185604.1 DUF6461 domain-containing protein [Solirubrobacter phytolaccae]